MPLVSPITFVPPIPPPVFEHFTVGGAGDTEYTWHLSVIDGGQPRESDDPAASNSAPPDSMSIRGTASISADRNGP